MKKTPTPDPQEFARKMLWHVCGLEAQMVVVMHMLARQFTPDLNKSGETFLEWMAVASKEQKKLYVDALKEIGIPPKEPQNLESTENDD